MWITDWSQIEDEALYIVAPIKTRSDGTLRLFSKMESLRGLAVKDLRQGCYAALLCPVWDGKMAVPQVSSPS